MKRQTFIKTMRGIGFWDQGDQTTNTPPHQDTPPAVVNASALIRASPTRTPPHPPALSPVMAAPSAPVATHEPAPQSIRDRLLALDVDNFCYPTTEDGGGNEKIYYHNPQDPFGFLVSRTVRNAVLAREAASREAIERAEPALARFLVASRLATSRTMRTGYIVEHLAFAVTAPNIQTGKGKRAEVKPKKLSNQFGKEERWQVIEEAIVHSNVGLQRLVDDLTVIQTHLPTLYQHVAELCLGIITHDNTTTVKILDVARTESNESIDKDSQDQTSKGVKSLIEKVQALKDKSETGGIAR